MNYLKFSLGIFAALAASRFIPHPPNFTSLLALSFYIPAIFGIKYILIVIISLFFTDLIIGLHSTMIFTYGSVFLIGALSKYFNKSILFRITGALFGALLFFLITNFGVWLNGFYGLSLDGLIICYIAAIPFFAYTLISTFLFSTIIEIISKFYQICSIENKT